MQAAKETARAKAAKEAAAKKAKGATKIQAQFRGRLARKRVDYHKQKLKEEEDRKRREAVPCPLG